MSDKEELDESYQLPSGDDLRVFLIQDCIPGALIRQILRHRGVFVSSTDKKALLPFLLLSYLTPDEFETLLESARKKEDSPKLRSKSHSLTCEGKTLEEMLPQQIDVHAIANDEYGNSKVIGMPFFVSDPQGGRESYVMRYKVERFSIHADWTKARRVFDGDIRYTLNPEAKRIEVTATHTAPETEKVNQQVVRRVENDWKEKEYIDKKEDTRVLFSSFTNQQRILFLMKFTAFNDTLGVTFKRLSDLSFKTDESVAGLSEARLLWMKDKVKKVRITGDTLHDVFFFTDKACQPFVIVWETDLAYSFTTRDASGNFTACLEFANYGTTNSPHCEFQISIPTLAIPGKPPTHPDCTALKKHFILLLNGEKQKAFSEAVKPDE